MSFSRVILFIIGWWLLLISIHTFVIYSYGYGLQVSFIDALTNNCLLTLSSFYIINSLGEFKITVRNSLILLSKSIGLAIISILLAKWLIPQFIKAEPIYLTFLSGSLKLRIIIAWLIIISITFESLLWFYIKEHKENEKRKADTEKLAKEAELSNLRKQLQPHFLFNSLNSISALINNHPAEARKMIHQLSDFLRGTLKKEDQQMVPFSEELKHLQLYLDIEKVRFGHRLNTSIKSTDKTKNYKIPNLLLQPIVENAIKFGLYDTTEKINIEIEAQTAPGYLTISVKNPFDNSVSISKKGTGFGLSSIQRRLYLLYARNDLLSTQQERNMFITTIKIPQHT